MKNRKKLILQVIAALLFFSGLYFGVKSLTQPKTVEGDKKINIVILNKESSPVFEESFNTDALLLGDLMDEINDENDAIFIFTGDKSDEFGRFLTTITLVDIEEGDFWLYESDNNVVCKEEGFCPGVDMLAIEDGDNFTFNIFEQ